MGLAEKKLRATIEGEKIPGFLKSLKFGHPYASEMSIEVDWPTVEAAPDDLKYLHDNFGSLCGPIDFALKKIGMDKVGKDAVKAGLKSLKFVNKPELPETKYSMKDGTLLVEIPLKNKKLTTLPGMHTALMNGL